MKLIVRLILSTLLVVLSIGTALAGAGEWTNKAKDLQASYLQMANDKYLPCFTLSTPPIPDFTEKDDGNQNLFNEFEKNLDNWLIGIEKTVVEKCRPQPPIINFDTDVSNIINNFYTKLKTLIPTYCVEVSLSRPKFTGDQIKDSEIYNEWLKSDFNVWSNQMLSDNKMKCIQTPTPEVVLPANDWDSEIKNNISSFKQKLPYLVPIYCVDVPIARPVFTGDSDKDREIFNFWIKSTYVSWTEQMISENKNKCGQVTTSENLTNIEVCRLKMKEKSVALDVSYQRYNEYSDLWKDRNKLTMLLKDRKWSIGKAHEEYLSLISSEITRANSIWQTYDVDGNLKSICSLTTLEIYGEWTYIERLRTDLIQSLNLLKELISQTYTSIQESEQQNNSYDDPAVFYEQVDHYYMKYVTSSTDWLKSLGINFSFLTTPPDKPVWTNTKDGSNAKLVNNFIYTIGTWWSVEGLRIQEAYAEFNLKNIQSWSKNLQINYSEYVTRVALEKFGSGGTYRFSKPIPAPSKTLLENPTKSLMENFENEINDWSMLEIKNLGIENYTPIKNGEVEAQVQLCLMTIDKAKTYFGRFDSQISYLTYIWSDYKRLLEVLKTKNLNLIMYRIQIDQEVQNPYLSDLYDVVPKMLAGAKANCGYTNKTSTTWAETYQLIEKEVLKLRNFLIAISNYYDQYRFTEPKLIPQIGKITQIVGGCRVEILNYDSTFKWYAKGNMVVDVNGIATITNGSVDQYLSTEKAGYQTVNYIEGIFKCPGIPKLSANTVDVQAPVMSLLSLSKSELYRGQSFIASVLITDNKEVNNFRISVVDQIGQTYSCYDGVAWRVRIQGDSNVGVYQIECWIRSVSYDGVWKLTGAATDLNFNTASFELTKIKILYGEAPQTSIDSNTTNPTDSDQVTTRTVGTANYIAIQIRDKVMDQKEETLLLAATQKIRNLPKTTRSSSLSTLTSIKNQINVVIETPKICKYQNGVIRRIAKGICSKSIEIIDSAGNQYLITQQVRFR